MKVGIAIVVQATKTVEVVSRAELEAVVVVVAAGDRVESKAAAAAAAVVAVVVAAAGIEMT